MGQVAPLGAMTDTQGAMSSKGVRGGHNLNLALEILELQLKSKKEKGLGVFYCSL